jgi:hypothetical protein
VESLLGVEVHSYLIRRKLAEQVFCFFTYNTVVYAVSISDTRIRLVAIIALMRFPNVASLRLAEDYWFQCLWSIKITPLSALWSMFPLLFGVTVDIKQEESLPSCLFFEKLVFTT